MYAYDGAYNKGNFKVIINVSKYIVTNFGRSRHNFFFSVFYVDSYGYIRL